MAAIEPPVARREISFFVAGVPVTAGSKRVFMTRPKDGTPRPVVTDDAGAKGKAWRVSVQGVARTEYHGAPLVGPLGLFVTFSMPRLKVHLRKDGMLKDSAPCWVTVRPDATKLLRALEDALTGILWVDDAQIVKQYVQKIYGPRPGADVRLFTL